MASDILSPNGKRVSDGVRCSGWKPPNNSPYFGFMSPSGPLTVSLACIAALVPQQTKEGDTGNYLIIFNFPGAPQVIVPAEEGLALTRRLGWKEGSAIE